MLKQVVIAMSLIAVTSTASAQSTYVPYVNEEEQTRYDRIVAPFLAGEVPPMEPSNFERSGTCELDPEFYEWRTTLRSGSGSGTLNHLMNLHLYNRHLSILETRDCSCTAQEISVSHAVQLFHLLPIADLTGYVTGTSFYYPRKTRTLKNLVREFCGGRI